MTIYDILELNKLFCIEPSFSELDNDMYTSMFLDIEADDGRLLLDEEEYPIAMALHGSDGWVASSFLFRNLSLELIEKFEKLDGDMYQTPGDVWLTGLREYYSTALSHQYQPAQEDNRPGRDTMIKGLVEDVWGSLSGVTCLDCCCGSGVGSSALRSLGADTLAYDNDAALLSLGLSSGRLLPDSTMCIDAALASAYTIPVEAGVGLMLGDITNFNKEMWERIVGELLDLTENTMISVATEPEIRLVEDWCRAKGRTADSFENERDPIYDRWVCLSQSK